VAPSCNSIKHTVRFEARQADPLRQGELGSIPIVSTAELTSLGIRRSGTSTSSSKQETTEHAFSSLIGQAICRRGCSCIASEIPDTPPTDTSSTKLPHPKLSKVSLLPNDPCEERTARSSQSTTTSLLNQEKISRALPRLSKKQTRDCNVSLSKTTSSNLASPTLE